MTTVALVAHWDWVLFNYRLPLIRTMRARGVHVVLVCPRGDYTDRLEREADRWIAWEVDRPGLNPFVELRSVSSLTRIYRSIAPDLVQHYGLKPNLYGSVAAKRAGVPRIVNTFTGLGYLFSDDARAGRLRRVVIPLLRRAQRWTDAWAVALTPEDREALISARAVDPRRTTIVPEGIDAREYAPPSSRPINPAPVVFMAGRLLWDKGLAELMRAASSLHQRGTEARFVIAGEPDDGNPASVPPQQIAAWAEEGNVQFLGHRSDVPELLREADIAVLPSYHEGLPRFLLESAAAGLAIVASDIPGCRAIVEDGKSALLVPPRDADRLAEALQLAISDQPLRERLGRAAREVVVARFDEGRVVEAHLDLYRRLGLSL